MPLKPGIIFDMDGVIVHSNPAHKEAIQIFCDNHNQNVSESFLQNRLYGRTNKEWIPELFGEIDSEQLKQLADEKEQLFRNLFTPEDFVVSGIHDFLNELQRQEIPTAVATSAPGENADYILSELGIKNYFITVLDSSDVTKGKPDPEVYLKASKALDRLPEQCIVFEDSVSGVKAGLAAGATVVGITTTHSAEELEECDLIIDDFENLHLDQIIKQMPETSDRKKSG